MKVIKKIFSTLIICAMLTPTIVLAENEGKILVTTDALNIYEASPVVDTDITLFGTDSDNINSCVNYIIEQFAADTPAKTIDISSYKIPVSEQQTLFNQLQYSVMHKHPEIFFLLNEQGLFNLSIDFNDGVIGTLFMEYVDDDGNTIRYYTRSNEEIQTGRESIRKEKEHILSYIDDDMTSLEKALTVHDYIVENYKYDYSYESRTLDTMVMQKTGVCQGYTYLFGYMMDTLGIPWTTVPSQLHNHIWNKIQLNGKWYHVDVTFDDPSRNIDSYISPSSQVYHNYFLLSDSAIKNIDRDHTIWNDETIYTADDKTYDNYFLHGNPRQLVYNNRNWYYFDVSNNLCRIDVNSISGNPKTLYKHSADFESWRYTGKYSSLVKYGDSLYFNSKDTLYRYNTRSGNVKKVYTHEFDNKNYNIYGLHITDDTAYLEAADNINYGIEYTIEVPLEDYGAYSSAIDYTDGTANISITKNNNSYEIGEYDMVYIAEYNLGKLVNITSSALKDVDAEFTYDVKDNTATELKVFVWNDLNSPLAELASKGLAASDNN